MIVTNRLINVINKTQKFREMGVELYPQGKMPDIVVH
jgi:hypothetical protein